MRDEILNIRVSDGYPAFFYVGQEGFIVKGPGTYLLIDGYLTGGCVPGEPFGRQYRPPIAPEELDFIDFVLCSHDHQDHLDPRTLRGILSVNDHARFVVPAPLAGKVCREYGVPENRIIRMHEGKRIHLGDFMLTPVASAHEELHTDGNGDYFEMGFLLETGTLRFYHSGDCCVYDGLAQKVGKTNIVFLPVNGRSYYKLRSNIIGNMNLEEAVLFAKEAGADLFVPMHFDLFSGNSIPEHWIRDAVKQYAPGLPCRILHPGGLLRIQGEDR